ncbi:HAD-IA family hydrolase [Weissella confusa]|uniref:HAD-IA family hydrolase n=1 Tax=Weissella confusa TaxID=1583 RepID=UPI0022E33352|nr:HAD-IA family hydrolase [Weissella confusa]
MLDGAEDLLKNLVNQGYKLIAGTNGEQRTQELRLEHTGFGRYFDDVFISDAIGHAKPSTEFFDAIFGHRQDMDREESIMIGDGLASDIQGGNRYNLDTLWVNLHQQVNETPYQATYEVNELPTIMQIVSK